MNAPRALLVLTGIATFVVAAACSGSHGGSEPTPTLTPTPTPTGSPSPTPIGPSTPVWDLVSNPSAHYDEPLALLVDGSALFAGGLQTFGSGSDYGWRVEKRRAATGASDAAFGVGGAVVENVSSVGNGADIVTALAADPTEDAVYVGGSDIAPGNDEWRLEKRAASSGARIAAFGSAGAVVFDGSTGDEAVNALAVDASAVYALGIGNGNLTASRLAAIDRDTGATHWAVQTSSSQPAFLSLAQSGTSLYLGGTDQQTGHRGWRIEERSTAAGAPIAGFGASGVVREDVGVSGAGQIRLEALVVDGADLYLVGSDNLPGREEWRIEKRDASTGALNASFGTAGVVREDFGGTFARAMRVVPLGGSIFVAGQTPDGAQEGWTIEKRDAATGALTAVAASSGATSFGFQLADFTSDASRFYLAYLTTAGPADIGAWHLAARTQ